MISVHEYYFYYLTLCWYNVIHYFLFNYFNHDLIQHNGEARETKVRPSGLSAISKRVFRPPLRSTHCFRRCATLLEDVALLTPLRATMTWVRGDPQPDGRSQLWIANSARKLGALHLPPRPRKLIYCRPI